MSALDTQPEPVIMPTGYGQSSAAALPVALVFGRGAQVFGQDGRSYLDLFAGAGRCLTGHGDGPVAEAVAAQARSLIVSRHSHPDRLGYLAALRDCVPAGLDHLSWFSTGSEAVDTAIRLARARTGRDGVVVFDRAFHGRITGVRDFTDDRWHAAASPRPSSTVTRCPFPTERSSAECVDEAKAAVTAELNRVVPPAAVLIEPAQATGGNRFAAPGFLRWLAAACQAADVLLVFDEIFTGFGRTGTMFLAAAEAVVPDILVLGKGMADGLPVGAVLTTATMAATPPLGLPGGMSSTFGGNPLTVAAALATLDVLQRDSLAARADTLGSGWLESLQVKLGTHPAVAMIHGRGLMIGLQLGCSASGAERIFLDHGLVVGVSGDTVRINPPLTIEAEQLSAATTDIAAALDELLAQQERS